VVKRGFDFVIATVALVVLSPAFLVIALLIKRDSPGPVFYRGERVGRNGTRFRVYKFRTMVPDADRGGPGIPALDDPRITRFGRRLRRSGLDKLPQLINVVRGEMSLVGPRPEIPEIADRYPPLFQRLLALRPGITSTASLAYGNEERLIGTNPSRYVEVILPDRLALEIRYLLRRSVWTDLRIIVQTVGVVFGLDSVAFRWLARSVRRHLPWLLLDAPVIVAAFYGALFLRLLDFPAQQVSGYLKALTSWILPLVALYLLMNSLWGVHRRIWRFATAADVRPIFAATLTATAVALAADQSSRTAGARVLPLGVILLGGFFSACGMVFIRYRSRLLRGLSAGNRGDGEGSRAIIFGAGDAGQHLALRLLTHEAGEEYDLIGFADDDPRKRGQRIHGLPVLGGRLELGHIVQRQRVDLIIIAINNVRGEDLRQILTAAQNTPAQIRIIPNLFEVVRSSNTAPLLREVRVEDLLGRQAVQLQRDACERVLRGKVVLITGGCGSVGSELCRQVAVFEPKQLVLLDNNETGLYDLDVSLRATFRQLSVRVVVADVADRERMDVVFSGVKPDIIFHAAAYKHVPLMEQFPQEAVKVNVGGTAVTLEMARRYGAQFFVLVSTDKAVEPHSVMGATKRVAEMLVAGQPTWGGSSNGAIRCTAVRFGNVLGSRGSVVPTFARQIELGGPVTVTHPDMTRYFMDVSEAAGLIIQAASFTQGGDIFMLEMGERIRVDDLARKMIRMRGLRPEIDIPIVYTGVRPGEKLHEELVFPEEGREPTEHPLVHRVKGPVAATRNGQLHGEIQQLLALSRNGNEIALIAEVMRLAGRPQGNGARLEAASAISTVPVAIANPSDSSQ
jgi:FlaA1/EpsC-like NDP-sugar epimerase/lipopolysaccharide/colanic/teichoic acid biosynthesis glycosyltransferase